MLFPKHWTPDSLLRPNFWKYLNLVWHRDLECSGSFILIFSSLLHFILKILLLSTESKRSRAVIIPEHKNRHLNPAHHQQTRRRYLWRDHKLLVLPLNKPALQMTHLHLRSPSSTVLMLTMSFKNEVVLLILLPATTQQLEIHPVWEWCPF